MHRHAKRLLSLGLLVALLVTGCAAGQSAPTGAAQPTLAATVALATPTAAQTATPFVPETGAQNTPEAQNTPGAQNTPDAASTPEAQGTSTSASAAPPGAAGAYTFVLVPEESEARYRVREQLANVSLPNDAVGVTRQVAGQIVVAPDGVVDPAASRITVDLASLETDNGRRDNFVRRNVLETDQYPQAVFVPTGASGLPVPLPQSGDVAFQLTGDLTIRSVTRPVTWQVTGTVADGTARGTAVTSFTFDEFSLTQPRVPVVLSIEDKITLEMDVTLRQEGGPASGAAIPAAGEQPAAAAPACTAPAALTPPMTEGPYYTPNTPERTSLLEEGVPGTRLMLTGYVLDADCQPIPGAWLDFWQTDGEGVYDNAGYRLRGHQFTDAQGRYTLETVIPGLYPGRTSHIHVKVKAPSGPEVTSQLFFPGEAQNQADRIFDPALLVDVRPGADGMEGTFNFVVPDR